MVDDKTHRDTHMHALQQHTHPRRYNPQTKHATHAVILWPCYRSRACCSTEPCLAAEGCRKWVKTSHGQHTHAPHLERWPVNLLKPCYCYREHTSATCAPTKQDPESCCWPASHHTTHTHSHTRCLCQHTHTSRTPVRTTPHTPPTGSQLKLIPQHRPASAPHVRPPLPSLPGRAQPLQTLGRSHK